MQSPTRAIGEYRENQSRNKQVKKDATQAIWGERLSTWPKRIITVGVLGVIGMGAIKGCGIANENGATEGVAVAGGKGFGESLDGAGNIFSGGKTIISKGPQAAGVDVRNPIDFNSDGSSSQESDGAVFGGSDSEVVVGGGAEAPAPVSTPETPAPVQEGFVYNAVQPTYEVAAGVGAYVVVNECGGYEPTEVANDIKDSLFNRIEAISPDLQDGLQPGDIANCLIS